MFSIFFKSNYTFEGKNPYENVIVLLYRHWFILLTQLIGFIFLLILPFAIYTITESYIHNYNLSSIYWFITAVYFLIWWFFLFYKITMFLLDTWIVTDHRILDSKQHGFFNRTVSELHLSRIQDLSVHINGPLRTFLDLGDLNVQSAGAENKFLFQEIPHPNKVRDEIMRAHSKYIAEHPNKIEIHDKEGI